MDTSQSNAIANERWVSDGSAVTAEITEGLMSADISSYAVEHDSQSHPLTTTASLIPLGGTVSQSHPLTRTITNRSSGVIKEGNLGVLKNPRTQTTMQSPLHKAEEKYVLDKFVDEEKVKQRQLKAILNKLTPQNFQKLVEQVIAVNIDNAVTLYCLVSQIFEKALMEPTLCEMYANLCLYLSAALPNFSQNNENITFRRLLLNKCQEEFEKGGREQETNEASMKHSDEKREEKQDKAKRRKLGNIRLIGELFKKKMLTERIMHECIKKLLGPYLHLDEDVVALCELMSIIGEMIDHPKAKEHMDAYFEMMRSLSNSLNLSSRVRLMLKYVIDLRNNKWAQRRKVEDPLDTAQPDAIASAVTAKKHYGDFLFKSVVQCTDHPEGFELTAEIAEELLSADMSSHVIECDAQSHPLTRTITDGSSGIIKEGNFGVLKNPRTQTTMQSPLHKAEEKYVLDKCVDEEKVKQRQLKAILNKLTPQNFQKLVEQVIAVNIDNAATLCCLVSQIFEKALMEPTLCEMCANLCLHLSDALPNFSQNNEKITFKRLLLNKCQEEFERGGREQETNEASVKHSDEKREEKQDKAKRRKLGNIRLIGELFKKKMLTEWIMHECIRKLLGPYLHLDEDVVALCELMITIGEMIDHPKTKDHMDAYFEMMRSLSNSMNLSCRVRLKLKYVIDLRNNKWKQRRKVEGPMDTAQPDANASVVTTKKYS